MEPDAAPTVASATRWMSRLLAVLLSPFATACAQEITLPVHVYLYAFAAAPAWDSSFDEQQVRALFEEINGVWRQAEIRWQVASVERVRIDETRLPAVTGPDDRGAFREKLLEISPPDPDKRLWKVCLMREFPVPGAGIYVPETRTVFYAEQTRGAPTRSVNLAHELGHALDLPHVTELSNLMHPAHGARGNTEAVTELTPVQIATARARAPIGPAEGKGRRADDMLGEPGLQEEASPGIRRASPPGADRRAQIARRLRSFDADSDGIVLRSEVPEEARRAFDRADLNQDGLLDPRELENFKGR